MDIILYSTGCPRCRVLEKKLEAKGVAYTENNNIEEMIKLGITEVPMLGIGDELKNFSDSISWINNQ